MVCSFAKSPEAKLCKNPKISPLALRESCAQTSQYQPIRTPKQRCIPNPEVFPAIRYSKVFSPRKNIEKRPENKK